MIHNFNSGPSVLPKEVFEEASRAIIDFNHTGLSILEIGHRTRLFEDVLDEARHSLKELMKLDDQHEVLFLHGGASTQFFQIPMTSLDQDGTAAYLDCGTWGIKAIKEAKLFGNVDVVASSADRNYSYIPKGFTIPADARYFHYTTNNTIEGTQLKEIPETGVPLIADMSSDILSRTLDFNRFALIYAGAQKNIGAAGVNIVVIRKDILGHAKRSIPTMMDYRSHIETVVTKYASRYCDLCLHANFSLAEKKRWCFRSEKRKRSKAKLLYDTLDSLPDFNGPVAKEDRSDMNVVFTMNDPTLETKFLAACKANGMVAIQGHRSVGGFRASLYNALPIESVVALTDLMKNYNS